GKPLNRGISRAVDVPLTGRHSLQCVLTCHRVIARHLRLGVADGSQQSDGRGKAETSVQANRHRRTTAAEYEDGKNSSGEPVPSAGTTHVSITAGRSPGSAYNMRLSSSHCT